MRICVRPEHARESCYFNNPKVIMMAESIRSSEFGDWLASEIARTRRQSRSADAVLAQSATLKLEALNIAKQGLMEFLRVQKKMLDAAHAAHRTVYETA